MNADYGELSDMVSAEPQTHDPYGQVALKMLEALAVSAENVAVRAEGKLAPFIDQNTVTTEDEEADGEFWPQYFAAMRAATRKIARHLDDISSLIDRVEV